MFNFHHISSGFHQSCVFDYISVNYYYIRLEMLICRVFLKINNCHLEYFAPIFVRGQNGSEGVVD